MLLSPALSGSAVADGAMSRCSRHRSPAHAQQLLAHELCFATWGSSPPEPSADATTPRRGWPFLRPGLCLDFDDRPRVPGLLGFAVDYATASAVLLPSPPHAVALNLRRTETSPWAVNPATSTPVARLSSMTSSAVLDSDRRSPIHRAAHRAVGSGASSSATRQQPHLVRLPMPDDRTAGASWLSPPRVEYSPPATPSCTVASDCQPDVGLA